MQDWKDNDLKSLFDETRSLDHSTATRFERDWLMAQSIVAGRKTRLRLALVMCSLAVIAVSVAVVVKMRRSSPRTVQTSEAASDSLPGPGIARPSTPFEPPPGNISKPEIRIAHVVAQPRHRRPTLLEHDDRELISKWRSPTDFLLESPAREFLRTVPNIEDSLVKIELR